MPKYLTITEARQQMLRLPDQLVDEPVIITKRGKPVMVALSYEHFASRRCIMEYEGRVFSDAMSTMRLYAYPKEWHQAG